MVEKINKLKAKQSGFTIVELLIVIVVIGILAAITIVAYSGITNRANSTKSQTSAANSQKVAEAINADTGSYPSTAAAFATGSLSTKLPSGITMGSTGFGTPTVLTAANGLTTVTWDCLGAYCTATNAGGRIGYWNFTTPGINYVYVGSATSGSTFTAPTT
jgi:prepilin-type N-terminal cleavage/methylation domain-containing protein